MTTYKSYIDTNGRLAIPAKLRQQLKLKIGDEVSLTCSGSDLVMFTFHSHLEKARGILEKYKEKNTRNGSIPILFETLEEDETPKERDNPHANT